MLVNSLLLSLINQLSGFFDLGTKSIKRRHDLLDLVNWQLNKHTSDLWSSLWRYQHVYELKDGLTNLVLQVWVLLGYRWEELHGYCHVSLIWGHLSCVLNYL